MGVIRRCHIRGFLSLYFFCLYYLLSVSLVGCVMLSLNIFGIQATQVTATEIQIKTETATETETLQDSVTTASTPTSTSVSTTPTSTSSVSLTSEKSTKTTPTSTSTPTSTPESTVETTVRDLPVHFRNHAFSMTPYPIEMGHEWPSASLHGPRFENLLTIISGSCQNHEREEHRRHPDNNHIYSNCDERRQYHHPNDNDNINTVRETVGERWPQQRCGSWPDHRYLGCRCSLCRRRSPFPPPQEKDAARWGDGSRRYRSTRQLGRDHVEGRHDFERRIWPCDGGRWQLRRQENEHEAHGSSARSQSWTLSYCKPRQSEHHPRRPRLFKESARESSNYAGHQSRPRPR